MRVAIVLLAILAVVCAIPAEKSQCTKVCTADYTPVCGVPKEGKGSTVTFGNTCVMEKYNCESQKNYVTKHAGECGDKSPVRLS